MTEQKHESLQEGISVEWQRPVADSPQSLCRVVQVEIVWSCVCVWGGGG